MCVVLDKLVVEIFAKVTRAFVGYCCCALLVFIAAEVESTVDSMPLCLYVLPSLL